MECVKIIPNILNSGCDAHIALKEHIDLLDMTYSYAKMMQYRIAGFSSEECNDIYYVAYEDGKMLSRLWNGWGRHKNAIGNFGNFLTIPEARGKGYGGLLLEMWFKDINEHEDAPLGLFCSAGSKELVALYKKFGFRLAVRNTETGPLYKPLKDSPETFEELYKKYYVPSEKLIAKAATIEYRHEIDLLLKFALLDLGEQFGFEEVGSLEEVFMLKPECSAKILFTENGNVAGWQYINEQGKVFTQVYPLYKDVQIINL